MHDVQTERWRVLCAQAEVEQDNKRFTELVCEINQILRDKEERLANLLAGQMEKGS
jgi:hypothetical protein